MNEIWKPLNQYFKQDGTVFKFKKGTYEVSNLGRIRTLDRKLKCMRRKKNGQFNYYDQPRKGKIIAKTLSNKGYHMVSLFDKNNYQNSYNVHLLVAQVFHPNRSKNLRFVTHINGDKLDNRATNLKRVKYKSSMLTQNQRDSMLDALQDPCIESYAQIARDIKCHATTARRYRDYEMEIYK
jgi:hypothetical protein